MRIFIIIIVLTFIACDTSKINNQKELYRVVKIKSINNTYLIDLNKDNTTYTILTLTEQNEKHEKKNCKKIEVSKSYNFNLKKYIDESKIELLNLSGVRIENKTIELPEEIISNIYIAQNLKGLCITP